MAARRGLRPRLLTAGVVAMLGLAASALAGAAAYGPSLASGFPASRVKLDPPAVTAKSATGVTFTATVVDWRGKPMPGVRVGLWVLSGPDHPADPKAPPADSGVSDGRGQAILKVANNGHPGLDVVQATFTDGLEIHKSNRPFIGWESGPPASAIPSPASISVSPTCFQPAAAAALTSDVIAHEAPVQPAPTPPPIISLPFRITVTGDDFDPFSSVLITFDAAPGAVPSSFSAKTDGFGHFSTLITPDARAEGQHLVRADDFREREATVTFTVPCFQPSLSLDPPIGPPGFVTVAVGTGFPSSSPVILAWDPGITAKFRSPVQTDRFGAFQVQVLILYHDRLGPRRLRAFVANPQGPDAGAAPEADAPFLVTLGRAQPPDFVYRR